MMKKSTQSLGQITSFDLDYLNKKFSQSTPKSILTWCVLNFPNKLVQISNFTIDNLVITDIIYRYLRPEKPTPVVFIDTLHHFPQTIDLARKLKEFYGLDLKVYKIAGVNSKEDFARKYGQFLWDKDLAQFHYLTKYKPLQQALTELKVEAYIVNTEEYTRNQAEDNHQVFFMDQEGRIQINPLANWSRVESWAYAYEHDLIYNPLYDQGYSHIGDQPLTKKL